MKTKSLFRYALQYAIYSFVFFCTAISAFGQCPTITNPTPPPICDAAGYTFADLSADFATDEGGGIVWYDALTGGNDFGSTELVSPGTYYADDSSGSCSSRNSVTVTFEVDPVPIGASLDKFYCSNDNATIQDYIDDTLASFIPSGGNVAVYYDFALTNQANASDALSLGIVNLYSVFQNSSSCTSQIKLGKSIISVAPADPTPSSPQLFCSDSSNTIADLDPGTTSSVSWYNDIDVNGDPVLPVLPLSTILIDGNTYYVQIDDILCDSNTIPVTVTINDPFDPGTSGSTEYCQSSIPTSDIDLISFIGGSPDLNGTWAGPIAPSGSQGTVNISTLTTPGVYTFIYTVPANGACPSNNANVSITINETFTSGTIAASNPAEFCESALPSSFDLFSLLDGEDPNGLWTQGTLSSDPAVTSPIDLSGFTPGTYNFTYTQNVAPNPCPEESTTVQIIVNPQPDTGVPTAAIFCENDLAANSPLDLFGQLTGNEPGGTWTDDSSTGALTGSNVNITGFTIGSYNFTYSITSANGCTNSSTVVVTVEPAPESGNALAPIEICEEDTASNSPFDLFTLLDGTQDLNGTWYAGTDTSGAVVTNPIDSSTFADGTYNYTYSVPPIGSCTDVDVTVQIIVNPQPDTGVPTTAIFCENDLAANSPLDLFGQLTGNEPGGTWTDDSSTGALTGSNVNMTGFTIGSYNFTYSITSANGCTNSSTVVVTVEPAPESGNALAPIEICEEDTASNSPFDLFTLLDGTQDLNGTWYAGTDTSGAVVTNPIDISTFADGTYNYTYSVPPIGSCTDVDVTVQIIVNPQPDTGVPTTAIFCENDLAANSPLDLFGQLTGNEPGGTWTDDSSTGALTGSNVNITGFTIGSYNFTYSITSANGCTNSSTVVVTVEPAPESGNALAPIEICEEDTASNSPFDLFTLLDGTQDLNGTWYAGTDTSGAVVTNPIDISTFADGTYNYTYSIPPIGSCTDVDVTVQIIVNPQPDTGVPTTAIFCENDLAANSPLDLFGQLTGNEPGGTWTDDSSTGALTGSNVNMTGFTIGSYNFTYSITSANGCTNSSTVVVTVEPAPESGTPNPPAALCISEITSGQTFNLFDLLEGEDQTGVWNDDDATGSLTDNLLSLDSLGEGSYNFTYDVDAIGTCDDVLVTVTVIINDATTPTGSASQEFCDSATVADLSATGTTIQWYDNATGGTPLAGTDNLIDGETYYATQINAVNGCESSSRFEVTATIYQSPNSGNLSTAPISSCESNNVIDLFNGLDGTQDAGGIWQDTDGTGALTGNIFDATLVSPGTYQFRYYVTANSPCIDAFTDITVTIETPLSAGSDSFLDACSVDSTTDLFTLLGSADTGGTWSPALASGTGVFDPSTDTSGTYTYTISNSCGTDSSDVVVTVTQAPNAGIDNTISICVIDGTIDLFTQLGGTPDTNGVWSPALPSGTGVFDPNSDVSGVYTYTVTAVSPCATDAVSQVTVTVNDSSAPVVVDANPTFCLVDNPTVADLDAALNITGTVTWYADASLTAALNTTDTLVDGEDYFATQTNGTGCESSQNVQVDVTVNDASTPTFIDPNLELCINDNPTIMDLTLNISEYDSNLDNVIWYDSATGGSTISNSTILVNAVTYYASLYDATTGCESSVRSAITPDLSACGKIILPDGFSPNGDGVNDTYSYNNLEIIYPNFEIEIFNRYGNLVYKGNASTPRFDGTSTQARTLVKGNLPVGVYFYVFKFNDNENKPEQGRLYLSR
jgi:gliding motility-associated-like protein